MRRYTSPLGLQHALQRELLAVCGNYYALPRLGGSRLSCSMRFT